MNKDLIKLIVDTNKGNLPSQYTLGDAKDSIREALVELNGGSTKLNYRNIRDGKANGFFTLIEEVISKTVVEGLPEDCELFQFADFRNLQRGDKNVFTIRDNQILVVATVAAGTQGLRRQRVAGGEEISVKTKLKGIKIYEELERLLAGRIDILEFIDMVSKAFIADTTELMASAIVAGFGNLATPYSVSGTFSEDKLTTLIDHIEAKTGKTAMILGSKQAIRKITSVTGADANSAKEDLYALGYFGKFHTNPIIAMKNGHKQGTNDFILNDTDLYVVAADDKFLKVVTEGDTLILDSTSNPANNQDLSVEYSVYQKYGVAAVMAEQHGVYHLA